MNQNGLNGLWGWIKKNLKSIELICASFPPLGTEIAAGLYLAESLGLFNKTGQPKGNVAIEIKEPTISEQIILDRWFNTQFKPFYTNLLMQFNTFFESNDFNTQLQGINAIAKKMEVAKQYYAKNSINPSLSPNALMNQQQLMNQLFKVMTDQIATIADSHSLIRNTVATQNIIAANYKPLVMNQALMPASFLIPVYINPNQRTAPVVDDGPATDDTGKNNIFKVLGGAFLLYIGYKVYKSK